MRFKNRFLVLEAQPIDIKKKSKFLMKPHALYSAIMEKVELLYGDFGVAAVKNGFMSKYSSEITQVSAQKNINLSSWLYKKCWIEPNYVFEFSSFLRLLM